MLWCKRDIILILTIRKKLGWNGLPLVKQEEQDNQNWALLTYLFYNTLLPHCFISDKEEKVGQLTLAACSCYRPWTTESITIYILQQQVLAVWQICLISQFWLSTRGLNLFLLSLECPYRKKAHHITQKNHLLDTNFHIFNSWPISVYNTNYLNSKSKFTNAYGLQL